MEEVPEIRYLVLKAFQLGILRVQTTEMMMLGSYFGT